LAQQGLDRASDAEDEDRTGFDSRRARRAADRFEDEADDADADSGGSVNVQIVAAADERTNSVVVRGPAELLDLVAEVLASLDSTTTQLAQVRVYQLKYADAMNTADVINSLFGEEQRAQSNQRGFPGPMMFRGPGGRDQRSDDEDGSQATVVAAADSQTNTVVVAGPENLLAIVSQVVEQLDAPIPDVADVKVFHLEYADAQDTAELINEVFGESASSRSSRSRGQDSQRVRFMRAALGGQQEQAGGIASAVAVIASADSRTNSVVVSGPPDTLEIIAAVVKDLDENPEQERRIFVYPLRNGNAENVRDILNNLFTEIQALNQEATGRTGQQFQGRQQAAPGGGGQTSDSGGDDLSEDTYFEADTDTNALLIMTSSKNYEKIKPILDELDKPVGQVLIKVLFAEITHSDGVDLGTEFSMVNIRSDGDRTTSTTSFGSPGQGLSVNVLEGDLDVTLNALQETGRLNVLSRPYILTRNNQLASISIAEEVPIPTGSTTVAGQTQVTVEYRNDIGIVLDVTPSINPDGLVNMTVSPQITTRTSEKVSISENLEAETFATRSADTRVAVEDGQTIVIGGLIEDQITDTTRKVPLLGDLPLAGMLFSRKIREKSKTELLIFLTPHVAATAADLTPISETERQRSNLDKDEDAAEMYRRHMEGMRPGSVIEEPDPSDQ
jgi:general secretion pathway protein D